MKFVIKEDTGSAYWLENGVLMFAPLTKYNTFDTEEGGEVDESLKDEPIGDPKDFDSPLLTLGDIWRQARNVLEN